MRNRITVEQFCGTHELGSLESGTIFQFLHNDGNDNYYMVINFDSGLLNGTKRIVHLNTGTTYQKNSIQMVDVIRTPIKIQRV